MSQQNVSFDVDELMQLALRATERDQVEDAIGYLKRLLDLQPEHPEAVYLLGALHAEIGLFERATEEIARALELNPDMPTARLQLGLLCIRAGDFQRAIDAWEPLATLGEGNPLYLFRRGLINFTEGRISDCVRDLEQGIAVNKDNEPLNRDMAAIKAEAEKLVDDEARLRAAEAGETEAAPAAASRHALLSRYDTDADD